MRSYVRLSTKLRGRLGGGGGESGGGVPEDEVTDGDGLRSPATISSPRSLIWGPRSGLVPSPPIPASMIDMPLSLQALDLVLSAWAQCSCQRSACRHMPMLRREQHAIVPPLVVRAVPSCFCLQGLDPFAWHVPWFREIVHPSFVAVASKQGENLRLFPEPFAVDRQVRRQAASRLFSSLEPGSSPVDTKPHHSRPHITGPRGFAPI